MDCREARRLIRCYLAGEDADMNALKKHIETCRCCNRHYEEALKMENILMDALSPMSVSPAERVMRRIGELSSPRRWRRTFLLLLLILFVTVGLMLLAYYGTALISRMGVKRELTAIRDSLKAYIMKEGGRITEGETEVIWKVASKSKWADRRRINDKDRQYLDIWGRPYRLVRFERFYLVVSSGPNRRFEYGSGDDFAIKFTIP